MTPPAAPTTSTTRQVVDDFLGRLADGDPTRVAALYATEVDWALDWPAGPVAEAVPWIRQRHSRSAVEQHFRDIAAGNAPAVEPTSVESILVDGEHAVVLGVLRNVVVSTGEPYEARFALHLTVVDGAIVRHHVYEDSLAVALAAAVVAPARD